jgi:hypothetical protein
LNAGGIDHPRLGIVRKVPKEMSITRFRYADILPSLVAGLVLSLAAGSAIADDDIDWATALRAYYTAEVVYERCGFSASWEQLSALSESIDDAERQAGLPSSEQVSMRQEIEDDALSDEQAFCEENGRRLMMPDIPE